MKIIEKDIEKVFFQLASCIWKELSAGDTGCAELLVDIVVETETGHSKCQSQEFRLAVQRSAAKTEKSWALEKHSSGIPAPYGGNQIYQLRRSPGCIMLKTSTHLPWGSISHFKVKKLPELRPLDCNFSSLSANEHLLNLLLAFMTPLNFRFTKS